MLVVAVSAATAAPGAPSGVLSVEEGRGLIQIKGEGVLLGRVGAGAVMIVDQTPKDRWVPWIKGTVMPRSGWVRGTDVTFRLLGGKYKILVRGEGISISARGKGSAVLEGVPDAFGVTGIFGLGEEADCRSAFERCAPIPLESARVSFGPPETPTQSGKAPKPPENPKNPRGGS